MEWIQVLTIIGTIYAGIFSMVAWLHRNHREDINSLDNRHRQDQKEAEERWVKYRKEDQERWKWLFERTDKKLDEAKQK